MDKLSNKISQKDLRKLMQERKLSQQKVSDKIVSPLAKYDAKGVLTCVICRNVIKSATLWKVHVNSKQHKQNVEETKALNKKLLSKPSTEQKDFPKPKKSETKPSITTTSNIPIVNNIPIVEKLKHLNSKELTKNQDEKNATDAPEVLPEMFFDDPVVDAKIRNVDYKDAQDDEWDRFQREIKEETVASSMIIAGEQKNSAVEREIIEINEQIHHWSKVLDLEEKVERLQKVAKNNVKQSEDADKSSSEEEEEEGFNEYLDWRSKSFI